MSKGDRVTVHTPIGALSVTASRNGRQVRVTKGSMTVVEELTRGGRPTGTTLSVRPAHVIAIEEVRVFEDAPAKPRAKKPSPFTQVALDL
jgi:hypothetical protein